MVPFMLVKQKGIIIKTVDYGESDKIITILSESGAKIPLMVKRAKKSRTGMQANTQLFVYGLFIYAKLRGLGILNSVDVISQNYQLRLDIYESSYAALVLKSLTNLWTKNKFLNLIINSYTFA